MKPKLIYIAVNENKIHTKTESINQFEKYKLKENEETTVRAIDYNGTIWKEYKLKKIKIWKGLRQITIIQWKQTYNKEKEENKKQLSLW